jgi:hypothetical protein
MTNSIGFHGHIPTALLLIKAALKTDSSAGEYPFQSGRLFLYILDIYIYGLLRLTF